jgi:hypothetical protein
VAEQRFVYFHVGGHKTGTTFLQNVLWHNRHELRRDGMLYPGKRRAAHVWANLDLRDAVFKGYRAPQVAGAWSRLVDEIRQWDGPAIIDHEFFSLASEEHIARAMADLDFAEVHVVFTARDMARQLPAVWQEWVKNRDTIRFADFLVAVRGDDTDEALRLRALHDAPAILAKWSVGIPASQVHVITVPPLGTDPSVLWQRFAKVIGIVANRYPTDIPSTNTSLGAAEAAVLRRLNAELQTSRVTQPHYDRTVKFHLAPALAQRPGTRIELPEDAFDWAVEQAGLAVEALAKPGYDIVGDLDELVPKSRPLGQNPDAAPEREQAAAAIAGLAVLVEHADAAGHAESQAELGALQARLDAAERELRERREMPPGQRVKRCVAELSDQVGWLGAMRTGYLRVRRRG